VVHNWALAAVLRGDFRTGSVGFAEVALCFPEHLAAFYEASRCHFQVREFAAAHAFGSFLHAPPAPESVERSILFAFIGALHEQSTSLYSSGLENELGPLLAGAQSFLAAGNAEQAIQVWAQCEERDTTGIANIGTIESLIRLRRLHEAANQLAKLLEHARESALSNFLIHILLEICVSLYIAVLERRG
jgi:hypothetical protein